MIFFLLVALLAATDDAASAVPEALLGNSQKMMADSKYEFKDDSDVGECGCREVCTPPWVFIGESCILTDLSAAVSWSQARIYCKERKEASDLIVFKDANEFAEVLRYIRNINNPKREVHFWIGGSDEKDTGNWIWLTGEPMPHGSPFWGGDFSGNDQPNPELGETCAFLYFKNRHYINDIICSFPQTVPLCQYRLA